MKKIRHNFRKQLTEKFTVAISYYSVNEPFPVKVCDIRNSLKFSMPYVTVRVNKQ